MLVISGAALGLLGYMVFVEPRWFRIRRVRIHSKKKIPRPVTILHLSDTHFTAKNTYKASFFQKLKVLEPDFIFATGDIIDNDSGIEPAAHYISSLKARIGKYAVFGNHDYWNYQMGDNIRYHLRQRKRSARRNDIDRLRCVLKAAGIDLLKNESREVLIDGMPFVIAGTDDPVTRRVDFNSVLADVRKESFNILLTHFLDCILKMPRSEIDLAFAGHTHGGQIRLPGIGGFIFDFKLPRRYIEGIHQYNGMHTVVSRGVGAGRRLTPRFFCRPEAIWIEISSPVDS